MNKKYLLPIIGLFLLGNLTTANASVLHSVKWTGILTITGFSSLPSAPLNPDGDIYSMSFNWNIDSGVGNTHTIGIPTGLPLITTGTATIKNLFGATDFALDPNIIASTLSVLPVGTVTFGAGVIPQQSQSGALGTIQVMDGNFNSTLDILGVDFNGRTLKEDVLENANGASSLAGTFDNFDILFGNQDGSISRRFEVDIEVSQVPVPAAMWLFLSGIIGIFASNRKKIG